MTAAPRRPLVERTMALFTDRLALKLAALFFSLVIWLVVSGQKPTEELVPVRLTLTVDSGVTLREPRPELRALVVGRGRDVLKLWDTPLIVRRRFEGDVPDSVMVAIDPSDITSPVGTAVDVVDVRPRTVPLYFDVSVRKTVPVRAALRIIADSGYVLAGEPRLAPARVMISGQRRVVQQIDSLLTEGVTIVARDSLPIQVGLDTTGLGILVTPPTVSVRVPVTRALLTRTGRP